MASGWLTVLGWGGRVWLYRVLMNIHFCTVGAFCFGLGFFRFCLYADNILSWYPLFAQTLPGLCSLVFILVWVQCPCLAAVSIDSISFSSEQCVLQQTKFQRWRKTGHKGKSPNWENAVKSHTKLISNPRTSGYWQTRDYIFSFWGAKISCQHSQDTILKRKISSSSILHKRWSLKGLSSISMHPDKRIKFVVTVASSKS